MQETVYAAVAPFGKTTTQQKENAMKNKKNRRLKVYVQSNGYNYKDVPTIVLKGKWMEAVGFDIGTDLLIECEKGKLIINTIDRSWRLMGSAE